MLPATIATSVALETIANRRRLLALRRLVAKSKGPRLDPARLPLAAIERLIQCHHDLVLVQQLRDERDRRLA